MQQQARVVPQANAAGCQTDDGTFVAYGIRGVRAGGHVRRYRFWPNRCLFAGLDNEDLQDYPTADWLDLEFVRKRSLLSPVVIRVHARLYAYGCKHVFLARRTTQMSRALMAKCIAWCMQNNITDDHIAYKLASDVVAACQYLTPAEIQYQEIVGECSTSELYDDAQEIAGGNVKLNPDLKQKLLTVAKGTAIAVDAGVFLGSTCYTAGKLAATMTSSAAPANIARLALGAYTGYHVAQRYIQMYKDGWGVRKVADK